ncbi:MAG TPA: hypothetical protein P5253_04675 [bacterium]|jgi:cell division protein FtsL|nr:hypothetical protein [bacterium]HRR91555.1 hypothetical protein [bacterium]
MSKNLARESPYSERQADVNLKPASIQNKTKYFLARIVFISVMVTSIVAFSLFQVKLYSKVISYRQEITALEDTITDFSIKNEELRREAEVLSSPARLREEAERLGLQPSDRLLKIPLN